MNAQHKYCLPIITQSIHDVLETIEREKHQFMYFEIWLDYLQDVDLNFVQQINQLYPGMIIFLFRRLQLEPIRMPLEKRFAFLESFSGGQSLVDLDITSQAEEFDYIKQHLLELHLIGSYHNYHETPIDEILQETLGQMAAFKPDIVKIATTCQTQVDALRLLEWQQKLKNQKQRHIVLGMGNQGLITRIFCSLWGNELIFAPLIKNYQTADGQLTRQQFESIITILEHA